MARILHASGIWQRLRKALGGDGSSRQRGPVRRRLGRFEPLEQRRLLALIDMAAIVGTVFFDPAGDGLTPDDTPLEGESVQLYKDTGDQAFDPLADELFKSDITDVNGEYAFINLEADLTDPLNPVPQTYWVRQATAPSGQLVIAPVQQVIVTPTDAAGVFGSYIDQFNDEKQFVELSHGSDKSVDANWATDNGALGNDRDMYVDINMQQPVSLAVDPVEHHLSLSAPASTATWTGRVTWDGADEDPLAVDPVGLGGMDLTVGGLAEALTFDIGGDTETLTTFYFYTDATHWSSADVTIPQTGGEGQPIVTARIRYADLVQGAGALGPADVTNIGAIELEIVGTGGNDVNFEWILTVGKTLQTVDFQNYEPMTLGNLVFEDLNNDGLFDSGTESGIEGVAISLWLDANANGLIDGAGIDSLIGSVSTDAAGLYQFTDLVPGQYIAQIGAPNFDPGAVLDDHASTPGANDPDDNVDDDNNGLMSTVSEALSAPITLVVGGEPINDGDVDPNTNLTLDFGFLPTVDLSVNKVVTGGATQVDAADSFSYTIAVRNEQSHIAFNTVLIDTLPAGITLDATNPGYDDYDLVTRQITFNLGDLAPLANRTFQIDVTAGTDTSGLLTNEAVVASSVYEVDMSNNSSTADILSVLISDLAITKTDTPDPLLPNENLTYTITVNNLGPSTATDVTVVDTLPEGVTFVSASPAETSYDSGTRELTVGLPDIAVGDSDTVTVLVTVDSDVIGTIVNTATVTTTQNDPDSTNDTATEDTTVTPVHGLALAKDVSHATATAGTMLIYTIDVDNIGTADTTGVTIVDTLPDGVTFVSASGASVTDVTGQQVTLDLGGMIAGETEQVTIKATIDSSATGTLNNTATVTLAETENGGNTAVDNTDTAETSVQVEVDLEIDKQASKPNLLPGQPLTYTLLVTNHGPSDATSVTVVDALPDEVSFSSASGATAIHDPISHEVSFDIGLLEPGNSTELSIEVNANTGLDPTITPDFTNTATVSAFEPETDPTNNTDQAIVSLQLENASIAGMVFLDFNNDGEFNGNDVPLRRVEVMLTGTDAFSRDVQRTIQTNDDGTYLFDALSPGTYAIDETQPPNLKDGKDTAGTAGGNAHDDAITQIDLEGGVNAIDYTFAERLISKRRYLASS